MTTVQGSRDGNRRDELTQLLNHRAIHTLAETIPDRVYGVLVIDIDHFSGLNNQYGHRVGDIALIEFANRLTEAVGSDGELARIGADVFLAVLPNATLDTACALAERVCEGLRNQPFELLMGGATALTTSIGVACAPWHGTTVKAVWSAADLARYESKRNGCNRWTLATY